MRRDGVFKAQLARTVLGRALSEQARQLSFAEVGGGEADGWLLHGVVRQECRDCKCVQYPPRPHCSRCLSASLGWQHEAGTARVLATSTLHVSFDEFYQGRAPWYCGLVTHDEGPVYYAFLESGDFESGSRVGLFTAPDAEGEAVILAVRQGGEAQARATVLARRLR